MPEYIERGAAKHTADLAFDMTETEYDILCKELDRVPAADVAPVVHGRWIEYTKVIIPEPYNKWEQAWKCSECGFNDGSVAYNFCPNCGARMDLEESTDA